MYLVNFIFLFFVLYLFRSTLFFYFIFLFIFLSIPPSGVPLCSFYSVSYWISFLHLLNNSIYNIIIFTTFVSLVFFITFLGSSLRVILLCTLLSLMSILAPTNISSGFQFFSLPNTLNVKLTNGLLLIHPLLLYLYYSLVISYKIKHFMSQTLSTGKKQLYSVKNFSREWHFLLLGLFTLLLGSWWSHQELNWGGFWSWDLVEVFLLIVVIYNTLFVHFRYLKFSYPIFSLFFLFNFILYILSVRFNMINSIHNFISQANVLYKVSYVVYILTIVLFMLFYYNALYRTRLGTWYPNITKIDYRYCILLPFYLFTFYVLMSYFYFYILRSTTSLLLTLFLSVLIPATIAYPFIRVGLLFAVTPLVESVFICSIFSFFKSTKSSVIIHFYLALLVYYLFTYYGVYILHTTNMATPQVLWFFNFSGNDYLDLQYQSYLGTPTLNQAPVYECLRFFYADAAPSTTNSLSKHLVICPSSTLFGAIDCVTFFHKSFSKFGFSFYNLIIYFLLLFFYFSFFKKLYTFRY